MRKLRLSGHQGARTTSTSRSRPAVGCHDHRRLHAGQLSPDAAVRAGAEGEMPPGAGLPGHEVVRRRDHRRVAAGAGQPQHHARARRRPATRRGRCPGPPPAARSRSAGRGAAPPRRRRRRPRRAQAAGQSPPAGASAGSGTATWSPARRRGGRTARRRPRRACDRRPGSVAASPGPSAANVPQHRVEAPDHRRQVALPVAGHRRPEQFERRPGELLDHSRRPPRGGRPAGTAPAAAGRPPGPRTGRRSRRWSRTVRSRATRAPTTPASHGRCSATRAGCSASATAARIAGWDGPAVVGERGREAEAVGGEDAQCADRHR